MRVAKTVGSADTLPDLIERLENAEEGSRELDLDIALAIDHQARGGIPAWTSIREGVARDGRERFASDGLGYVHQIPRFTRSIDAALTLAAPSGNPLWTWTIHGRICGDRHDFYEAEITIPSREFRGIQRTPAIALCIAALKARSTKEPG